jgi:hypothetical protein
LKEIGKTVHRRWESYQNACPNKLHPLSNSTEQLVFPKRYRELVALAIASWFLPEWLSWEIRIFLRESIFSLDFNNKGLIQSGSLRLLVIDQREMIEFLEENYNPRQLFGTVLQEDLRNALFHLYLKDQPKQRRKIRRKGYSDKGTWRPPHRWIEHSDFSFEKEQTNLEKKRLLVDFYTLTYRYKLRAKIRRKG